MAKLTSIALILTILCLLVSSGVDASKQGHVAEEEINFLRDPCPRKGKTAKLEFYVHFLDQDHPNPTSYEVARANITKYSSTSFGLVSVQDRMVTVGPNPCSKQLGYQGMTVRSDFTEITLVVNNVMYFTSGEYANSTLTFHGRNPIYNEMRDVVVSGGTGTFRYAHGYSIHTNVVRGENFDIVKFVVYVVFTDKCIPPDHVSISKK